MPRKKENKILSFHFVSTQCVIENSKKIEKKFIKIRKYHNGSISSHLVEGGSERKKKKIIVPFRSYSTGNRKFQKNNKKIQKIKKSQFGLILRKNSSEKAEKERKQKLSFRSIPT